MSNIIRTFIAVEIPEKIISSIARVQKSIKDYGFKIRWVRPESMHLTLKFLGNIEAADTEKVGRAVFAAAKTYPTLSLQVKGIGIFPGLRRPRVVWVGITGQLETLGRLQETLDKKLEAIGFPKEKRPFKGHLTLGRIKKKIDPNTFIEALNTCKNFETETFTADRVVLYKSELKASGAVYTELMSARLA
ncbi:MAG: RNA 2',3'-cyclic phosphodiesterase [Deltaproteobacteria bacterium]|jgi:2'-5' RNA ligase|nr:RNA 2',3'-cyclic phosphodiesterase [Deltaproteobacteria bacterium]